MCSKKYTTCCFQAESGLTWQSRFVFVSGQRTEAIPSSDFSQLQQTDVPLESLLSIETESNDYTSMNGMSVNTEG